MHCGVTSELRLALWGQVFQHMDEAAEQADSKDAILFGTNRKSVLVQGPIGTHVGPQRKTREGKTKPFGVDLIDEPCIILNCLNKQAHLASFEINIQGCQQVDGPHGGQSVDCDQRNGGSHPSVVDSMWQRQHHLPNLQTHQVLWNCCVWLNISETGRQRG